MELFDYLNAFTFQKLDLDFNNDEINKKYQPFLINRFVSMAEIFIPLVNEINRYNVPKSAHYRYYLQSLPKRKQYFKYIKKAKDLDLDQKKLIAEYFEVGLKDAERYINIMEEKEIQDILDVFKYGKE